MNTMPKQNIRVYQVSAEGEPTRLIKASTAAQALRHVAAGLFNVQVAGAVTVAGLMQKGVQVEDVSAEPAAEAQAV